MRLLAPLLCAAAVIAGGDAKADIDNLFHHGDKHGKAEKEDAVANADLEAAELFAYSGTKGPHAWPGTCTSGLAQSPINIVHSTLAPKDGNAALPPLAIRYEDSKVRLHNNGHVVELLYDAGSVLSLGDEEYALEKVVFHAPAEHRMRDLRFPMEIQLVHSKIAKADAAEKSADADKSADAAIVSVLITEGKTASVLSGFWSKLPTEVGQTVDLDDITFNIEDILPRKRTYIAYDGSLTAPPCTEGVHWFILNNFGHLSPAQISVYQELVGANARPAQPLNDRAVVASASEIGDIQEK